ncbi:MAG: TrkH family potassium uptake protein, partial [Clostridia bacterium]|nr:TrkH family potassium uptake protein [Clostridia bacterium]
LKRFKSALKSQEGWLYVGLTLATVAILTTNLIGTFDYTQKFADALRIAAFQTAATITTTGYSIIPATTNVNFWPELSKWLLFLLMFIGGCAGSTAGGFKVSRVGILGCGVKKEIRRLLRPRNANVVKFEGKVISNETLQSVFSYFVVYVFIMICVFVVLCLDPNPKLDFIANVTATVSCFNNIGPAYGEAVGGFFVYSQFSKIILSAAMLLGRLEIFPLLLLFNPSTWKKQ